MTDLSSKVKYYDAEKLKTVCVWQGIRPFCSKYLICGTTLPSALEGIGVIYIGDIKCEKGYINYMKVPNSISTSIYGPNYEENTKIFNFVGSYVDFQGKIKGFVYTGRLRKNGKTLKNPSNFSYPSVNALYDTVFIHSISKNLYIGNSGSKDGINILSFLYDIKNPNEYIEIKYPNSKTTTTYGIYYIGNDIYAIAGGYSTEREFNIDQIYNGGYPSPIGNSFMALYHRKEKIFSAWQTIHLPLSHEIISHIEGIYFDNHGNYSLSIDLLHSNKESGGYYGVAVRNNDENNTLTLQKFVKLEFNGKKLSSNSVAKNCVVGLIVGDNRPFQCKIH